MQSEAVQLKQYDCSASCSSTYELSPPPIEIMDNSLTSLNWLPEFQIPDINSLVSVQKCNAEDNDSVFTNAKEHNEKEELVFPLSPLRRCMNQTAEFEINPWRYKHDSNKPPFSYTTIIYLAIRSSKNEKVTLGEIYQWIKDHFMYYKLAESTWQNSVRHNLSLNDFFLKIPRSEGDPGKGSFWQINPEYESILTNEIEFQRLEELQNSHRSFSGHKTKGKGRRKINSTNGTSNGITGKSKDGGQHKRRSKSSSNIPVSNDLCHLPNDLDWVSLLNSQRINCISCTGIHSCKPLFGSPVLCNSDCSTDTIYSPVAIPSSMNGRVHLTPPTTLSNGGMIHNSLEDIVTSQESPAPLLPPWAESRSQSPNMYMLDHHPWAETKDRYSKGTYPIWPSDPNWTLPMSNYSITASTTGNSIVPTAQLI